MPLDYLTTNHPWTLLLEASSFPSREELVVMKAAMDGEPLRNAANELDVTAKEVKDLLKSGMDKLNVRNLYELIIFGLRSGIIEDTPIDIKDIEKQFEIQGFHEAYPLWLFVMNQVVTGKSISDIERAGEGGSKSSLQHAVKQISDKFDLGQSPAKFIRFSLRALNPIKPNDKIRGFRPFVSWAQKQGIGSKFPLVPSKFKPADIDPDIPVYNAASKRNTAVDDEPKPKVSLPKMSNADRKKLPPPIFRTTSIQTALQLLGIDKRAITPPDEKGSFWERSPTYLWNLLGLAKRRYDLEISHAHPDKTGGDYRRAAQLNAAWTLIKKLFARRGYDIHGK